MLDSSRHVLRVQRGHVVIEELEAVTWEQPRAGARSFAGRGAPPYLIEVPRRGLGRHDRIVVLGWMVIDLEWRRGPRASVTPRRVVTGKGREVEPRALEVVIPVPRRPGHHRLSGIEPRDVVLFAPHPISTFAAAKGEPRIPGDGGIEIGAVREDDGLVTIGVAPGVVLEVIEDPRLGEEAMDEVEVRLLVLDTVFPGEARDVELPPAGDALLSQDDLHDLGGGFVLEDAAVLPVLEQPQAGHDPRAERQSIVGVDVLERE